MAGTQTLLDHSPELNTLKFTDSAKKGIRDKRGVKVPRREKQIGEKPSGAKLSEKKA